MNLILAPEPAPWIHQLPSLLGPGGRGEVVAPWTLPARIGRWVPAPAKLRSAWQRRTLPVPQGFRVWGLPGWVAVEAGMRLAAPSTAATFRARFAMRKRVAQAVAALLPRSVETVLAPSLCAREVFAMARSRGARCVLLEDLPSLRALHADLDEAATRHPEESFLRNHRASAEDVARQEAERVLADELWVRSEFCREWLLSAGHAPEKIRELGLLVEDSGIPRRSPGHKPGAHAHHVALLAGPALARGGLREALAAIDARPQWSLWVRPAEGTDPRHLHHPRVRQVTAETQRTLRGVDVVLAPAWCESHPHELPRAVARGIPIIATDRASGFLPCRTVPRGNVPALVAELDALSAR
ncbi:hypothetical protein [Hyalangium versicolor]|uniref:hypothetical protein n=1 Tax=Hyalangium versicolor TaxID=2861190 RepID=UPI001CCCD5DA|nr:hypothetical protein [Hyalangium versicolor]